MTTSLYLKNLKISMLSNKGKLTFPIQTNINGIFSEDRQGAIVQSRKGDPLQLVHIKKEDFPYNVYVYNIEVNRIIGYLPLDISKELISIFNEGFCLDGKINEITGGPPYKYYGCNIYIFNTMTNMLPYFDEKINQLF